MYQFVLRYFDNVDVSNPCVKFKFVPNPIFFCTKVHCRVFPVAWTGYSFALSGTASAATRNATVASGDALPTTAFTAIALPSFLPSRVHPQRGSGPLYALWSALERSLPLSVGGAAAVAADDAPFPFASPPPRRTPFRASSRKEGMEASRSGREGRQGSQ